MRNANLVQDVTSPGGGGWSSEQRESLNRVRAFTPEQRAEALAATRASSSREDLAEIEYRQRKHQQVIAQVADPETFEEQEQLAEELCPRFDDWIRGRNRIMSAPARAPRVVAIITPRTRDREHRPAAARRTSSSSSTSSADPGDPDPEPPRRRGELRHIAAVLADAPWIPCPHCGQPLHERDGAHCGGCAITWWQGVR